MKKIGDDVEAVGIILAIFLFILGMTVLTFALMFVVGPFMFIGVCLLVAAAFVLWKQRGKIPAFQIKQPFWLLLIAGLALVVLSSFGLEMVSPEFQAFQNTVSGIFGT